MSSQDNQASSPPLRTPAFIAPRPPEDPGADTLPNLGALFPGVDLNLQSHDKPHDKSTQPNRPPPLVVPGTEIRFYLDDLPVVQYDICGRPFQMTQGVNELKNRYERETVSGRHLRYDIEVVQQPQKARACGAGPRSSADRRPVDPPPVVQLNVKEVQPDGTEHDITMAYEATFMLYTSLELARPIAKGRQYAAPTIPVLTGVAVASAAYLDRPIPAAYFIFPDLSVRHEGWYRLRFFLFEAIKNRDDADPERPFPSPSRSPMQRSDSPAAPQLHDGMSNRMDVCSAPFQVFSAKKFPGLDQSTPLSRVVAEQGCRVRIRRDVRQRKRIDKADPDAEDDRSSYHGTPQQQHSNMVHGRSGSVDSQAGAADYHRRLSMESQYAQPQPLSRQPSIASMTHDTMAPMTPGSSGMMSMGPPPPTFAGPGHPAHRIMDSPVQQSSFPPPGPSNRMSMSHGFPPPSMLASGNQLPMPRGSLAPLMTPDPMYTQPDSKVQLPPIFNSVSYDAPAKGYGYDMVPATATKRSLHTNQYSQSAPLKAGARPQQNSYNMLSSSAISQGPIEADGGDDDASEDSDGYADGSLAYKRADGSKGVKMGIVSHSGRGRPY